MLSLGIVRPSNSWSSPVHMAPKKSSGDYRALNRNHTTGSVPHATPPSSLQGCTVFSKLDFIWALW